MRFKRSTKAKDGIDLTPLIDVVFLLLIFFMISTTFVANPGIKVKLPEASTKPITQKPETIEVTLTKEHRLYLNGQEVDSKNLASSLKQLQHGKTVSPLLIRADGQVRHAMVVYVMDQAHSVGITQLSIATIERGH